MSLIFNGSLFMKNYFIRYFARFRFQQQVKAEMSLSGYAEFFAGSADQPTANGTTNHGIDKAGMDNGTYTRLTANYSSTMDNGIDVNGTMNATTRDCQGDKSNVCNVVNFNMVTLSGGFGALSVGERFAAGHAMMSRLTASVHQQNQMVVT